MGLAQRALGEWENAERHLRAALELATETSDAHQEASVLNALGMLYRLQGLWGEGEMVYCEVQLRFHDVGDFYGESQAWSNLGSLYLQRDRWTDAIACYKKSLDFVRALSDRV